MKRKMRGLSFYLSAALKKKKKEIVKLREKAKINQGREEEKGRGSAVCIGIL